MKELKATANKDGFLITVKEMIKHQCPQMKKRRMFICEVKFRGYTLNQETMHTGVGWLGYECKAAGIEYCPYCGGKLE